MKEVGEMGGRKAMSDTGQSREVSVKGRGQMDGNQVVCTPHLFNVRVLGFLQS